LRYRPHCFFKISGLDDLVAITQTISQGVSQLVALTNQQQP
jgi:hypothetical protein